MRDIPGSLVLLAPACRSSSSARASRSTVEAPLPPVFAFVRASGSSDVASLVHRIHSPPALRLPAVGLLLSSMVPTDLRFPSLARCATNSVADVEVGSRCLFNFLRRSINTKSYTSTSHYKPKVHKYWLQCFIFAMESSYFGTCEGVN